MSKIKNEKNEKENKIPKGSDITLQYNDKDIKFFEKRYKKRAIFKGKPTKDFITWLSKDTSHVLKKTVVELRNSRDLNNPNKVDNFSYEQPIGLDEYEIELAKLIKLAQNPTISNELKEKYRKQIKELMLKSLENQDLPYIANFDSIDISAQDKLLDNSNNYLGFVYFFWSAETMNFKPVGLNSINSLFEFVNVKQTFYLTKPAMITNDRPIYFCFDKIPYSVHFQIKDDMLFLSDMFTKKGYSSDIFYFMEKNKNYIRIYGYNKLPMRIWIMFLLILGFFQMLQYLITSTIFNM